MKHMRSVILALGVALVLVVSQAQLTSAQATGTIEIHKRLCTADAVDLFADCHDNLVDQEVSFSLDGGAAVAVDASGNLVFDGLAAGTYDISEVEGPPLEFVNLRVFCSVQDDDPESFEVTTDGPNFSVDLADGEYVVCDVYNIAENLSGLTPTPAPDDDDDDDDGVTQLPDTGSGIGTGGSSSALLMAAMVAMLFGAASLTMVRRAFGSTRH